MANRNYENNRIWTGHAFPVELDLQWNVGSTGAVTSSTIYGPYVTSVTRMGVGAYKIILNDNYTKLYQFNYSIQAPVTGSAVNLTDGLTNATAYQIVTLGTSTQANWETAGVPAGVTAAVGVGFVSITASAGTGTGTVKAIAQSGITNVELIGNPNLSLSRKQSVGGGGTGGVIMIQCYGPTDATHTTPIAVDPASGCTMHLKFMLSNSSVTVGGSSTVAAY